MRFRLRTLLIVLALGPPVLAGAWIQWPWLQSWLTPQPQFELSHRTAQSAMFTTTFANGEVFTADHNGTTITRADGTVIYHSKGNGR